MNVNNGTSFRLIIIVSGVFSACQKVFGCFCCCIETISFFFLYLGESDECEWKIATASHLRCGRSKGSTFRVNFGSFPCEFMHFCMHSVCVRFSRVNAKIVNLSATGLVNLLHGLGLLSLRFLLLLSGIFVEQSHFVQSPHRSR